MLEWKKEYETGVSLVDSQHQALFEQINKLEKLINTPNVNPPEVNILINFLANYAKNHFAFEESCMNRFKCPNHEENKAAHAKFMEVVTQFKAKIDMQGPQKAILMDLHNVAQSWIKSHILKIDVRLREVCK